MTRQPPPRKLLNRHVDIRRCHQRRLAVATLAYDYGAVARQMAYGYPVAGTEPRGGEAGVGEGDHCGNLHPRLDISVRSPQRMRTVFYVHAQTRRAVEDYAKLSAPAAPASPEQLKEG